MKLNISLILAHPTAGSFNHAIAQTARNRLHQLGHPVWFHDLYAEDFDPIVPAAEIPKNAPLPPAIQRHCDEVCAAAGIVIVHPNWWSQPPAMLKGWIDRVLRPGLAYNFVDDGQGGAKPVGLLKARAACVITTANTPQEKEVAFLGDPLEVFWRQVVFGLCGVSNVQRLIFSPVIVSQLEQRQQWLQQVESAMDQLWQG
jgi:NAD(P)H dehydrogenase (quinone)